jgi:hypothetical protein
MGYLLGVWQVWSLKNNAWSFPNRYQGWLQSLPNLANFMQRLRKIVSSARGWIQVFEK